MTIIKWRAAEFSDSTKDINWYWFFWSLVSIAIFSAIYFFQDYIFSSLLFFISILITIAANKKPKIFQYGIDEKYIYINNNSSKILLSNIKSYNIDKNYMKIIINTKNKIQPLILIPFERNQNIKKINEILSKSIKKDKELHISIPEQIINRIIGF